MPTPSRARSQKKPFELSFLAWLAGEQWRYWCVAGTCFALVILFSVFRSRIVERFGKRWERVGYLAVVALAFFAYRWPALVAPVMLNPDEAQMAAQGLTALSDPLPWHGFDPTTSGPISSYLLTLPAFVGLPVSMHWVHLAAALLALGSVYLFYLACRELYGEDLARVAALLPLTFYAFNQGADFVHYSSEHVPVALLLLAFWALAALVAGRSARRYAVVAGLSLGAVPFTKLQALPLAMLLGLFVVATIVRGGSPGSRRTSAMAFAACIAGWAVVMVGFTAIGGSAADAWTSYVQTNVLYATTGADQTGIAFFVGPASEVRPFVLGLAALAVIAALLCIGRRVPRSDLAVGILSIVTAAVAVEVVLLAHHGFAHYFLFALYPFSFVAVATLAALQRSTAAQPVAGTAIAALALSALVLPIWFRASLEANGYVANYPAFRAYSDPVAVTLRGYTHPGERIAIWGWMPQYYVETQTRMDVKDANVLYEVLSGPLLSYYRERFMKSMLANRPPVFVDAVAPGSFGLKDRATEGFEVFPALAAYVRENYQLATEVQGVRVYVRRAS